MSEGTQSESPIWRTELVCVFVSFSSCPSDTTSWTKEIETLYLQKKKNFCGRGYLI